VTAVDAQRVPILVYHSIAEVADPIDLPFTVTPAEFRLHMEALADWGARTETVGAYVSDRRDGRPVPPRTVIITIDDGYEDSANVALPVLAALAMTATVFITTGFIGTRVRGSRMVSWPQLRELHEAGIEIGAHGHTHVALDIVGAQQARSEIISSRHILEDGLAVPVESFAYPHGYYTRRLAGEVAGAGYRSASAARNGLSHPDDELFALSRLVVHHGVTAEQVMDLVSGQASGITTASRTVQRAAWRAVRRARATWGRGAVEATPQAVAAAPPPQDAR